MSTDGDEGEALEPDAPEESHEDYFRDVSDGCGCAEIWEYLSDRRRAQ